MFGSLFNRGWSDAYEEILEISKLINQIKPRYDDAISKHEAQIDRLKEYKNILINQAVTGKIKI